MLRARIVTPLVLLVVAVCCERPGSRGCGGVVEPTACPPARRRLTVFNASTTIELERLIEGRPPIVVLGVGHSGTSSVAHYFLGRGWAAPVLRPGVVLSKSKAEDLKVLVANAKFLKSTSIDKAPVASAGEAGAVAHSLLPAGSCWAVNQKIAEIWKRADRPQLWKDPQFVWTLHLWSRVFLAEGSSQQQQQPLLIHVRRDPDKIVRSHKVRGETQFQHLNMSVENAVKARIAWADWQLHNWCGDALSFDVASLKHLQVKNHHVATPNGGGPKPGPAPARQRSSRKQQQHRTVLLRTQSQLDVQRGPSSS